MTARRKSKETREAAVLKMGGRLTVERVSEMKGKVLKALAKRKDVVLELKKLSEVDLSFIQLLFAAQRSAERRGRRLKLGGPVPDIFTKAVDDTGFSIHEGWAFTSGGERSHETDGGGDNE
jgi:anti-anti-sigma regulatory factor